MKLASFTDNSQSLVKYGDTDTFLHVQISEDGTFVDLTQATSIQVPVANDDGLLFTKKIDPKTVANADSGIVDINFTADDQNNMPPDDYYLEIWVVNPDGTIGIYPADENQLSFTITDNLTLVTGDVVPAVAFDDFQNMFDTLQQQVQNAIANGLKGENGAKGDPGEGLDIKGQVTSVSALPKTASEGDGYLVGEELYVYTNGAWKDCGPIQGPQGVQGIQGKTGAGVSSTTIQYQISSSATTAPTGTWSDNIIATTTANPNLWMKATLNYTDGTTKDFYLVSQKGDKGDKGDTGDTGPIGAPGPVGAGLVVKGTVNNASQLPTTGNQEGYCYFVGTDLYVWDSGAWKNCGSVSPDLSNYITVSDLNNGLSTKDNVTDMRKPASDVAGIEEVSAKQDKIGYTPADDSKVVHSTVTELNSTDMNTVLTAGFYRLASGTNGMPNTDEWALYQIINLNDTNGVQLAYGTNNNISGMRSWHTVWTNGNAVTTFSNWVQVADDSKVAHNSGNEEIAGQKTFDTAPIDKATGNPYITKSDVTTAISAATSDAAYKSTDNNFLGDLQYKGNEVATTNLLQNFYQADDDNTARQKAESLDTPGFVWFSE